MTMLLPILMILGILSMSSVSCGRAGQMAEDANLSTYDTAYLPFVEDFVVPEVVHENEPFEVVLIMSAWLAPEALRGITPYTMYEFSSIPYPPPATGVVIGAWCWRDFNDLEGDELVTELHWPMNDRWEHYGRQPGWPAGTYTIQVVSAESPEWGGVSDQFMVTPTFETPYSEHQIVKEYTITVLPKAE